MTEKLRLVYRGKVLSKKNSKRIIRNPRSGKPMLVSNKSARTNEDDMINQFGAQTLDQNDPIKECTIRIVMWEPNWQRRDLDNQTSAILDALVGAKVIEDDHFVCVKGVCTEFGGVDKDNPRAEIEITYK